MNIPDEFSFTHAGITEIDYCMTKIMVEGFPTWKCTREDMVDHGVRYNATEIESNVKQGYWVMCEPVCKADEPEEPDLVFPFVVEHKDSSETLLIMKGSKAEYVSCKGINPENDTYFDYWSYHQCKDFIKSGIWIVKSVGEQKPVEAPVSVANQVDVLPVKIDTEEALKRVKALTNAIKELEEAYNKLKGILSND